MKAEQYRTAGQNLLAAEQYQKYLQLNPDSLDILQKKAISLSLDALSDIDNSKFQKADLSIQKALEKEWIWERGHELRVDLYLHFGELGKLEEEYNTIGAKDERRKLFCEHMLRTVKLTKKYSENLPSFNTSLEQGENFLWKIEYLWFFLLLPILWWVITKIAESIDASEENKVYKIFFVVTVLVTLISTPFAMIIFLNRKNKGLKNEKNKN